MTNYEKLKNLLVDVFLLEPSEFRPDLTRNEIDSWDSLGVVSMAVGIEETFGHHLTPEEATGVKSVQDIMNILRARGVVFDD